MSRIMAGADAKLYRAVITTVFTDGHSSTFYAGPFRGKAQATAAIGREWRRRSYWWRADEVQSVTGRVEVAETVWQPMGEEVTKP